MKRIIAFILSLIFIVSANITSYAKTENGKEISSFNLIYEEIKGTAVSLFARLFYKISGYDESVTEGRKEFNHSWKTLTNGETITSPDYNLKASTWISNEISIISSKNYNNPFLDTDVDLILYGNGREYKIPCFWDGNNTWKARFVCPSSGTWYFKTVCSDTSNTGLHNKTGKVICEEYKGNLDIYKHGFVTVKDLKKYFTYDDLKPFLYLGDTHWSLGDETVEMVREITAKRVAQGFTVIQSEPIGAKFDFKNGIDETDLSELKIYDEKFKIIADAGLVHANAEFFFPSEMDTLINQNGGYKDTYKICRYDNKNIKVFDLSDEVKNYLMKITRYWVARYSSYPVLWTLGQEVDNDFYWRNDNHAGWNYYNNPYLYVAEYLKQFDPYDHPVTAHQENTGSTSCYGNGKNTDINKKSFCNSETSIFYNNFNHDWYAAQWTPSKTSQSNFKVEKDYWFNSQGKPTVNYEGQYCYLWTKNFGSRMQGWCAYLNGMYGYGWGGHDTWSYTNIYDEQNDSSDGVDTVTSKEKIDATWQDSLEYPSAYQSGYMIKFFKDKEWWNLIPRFNNKSYFSPCRKVYYCYACNKDNSEAVIYFYSFSDNSVAEKTNTTDKGGKLTGTIGNLLPNETYKYKWFNPITGEYSKEYTFKSTKFGTYFIGEKECNSDLVFYMYR